ncbi:MAG: glycosyltransferase family 8 protein [Clostridia bacterium]|nr:glycosyltransferase family 8 protein [Clostridia bacterium]
MSFEKVIPVVYAADDNYYPFLAVSVRSIIETGSENNLYKIFVLNNGISEHGKNELKKLECKNLTVDFVEVGSFVSNIEQEFCVRDYYSKAIYYRIFIPDLFPEYEKIIYLDCDVILRKDIENLYSVDIENEIVAAVPDEAVANVPLFQEYTKTFLGIDGDKYFNSGVLVINCKKYKEYKVCDRFVKTIKRIKFEVAPDQDYLNVLCAGHIKFLDNGWNKMPISPNFNENDINLIHFNLTSKPWHYEGIMYEKYFWQVAKNTSFYDLLLKVRNEYPDSAKEKDKGAGANLMRLCEECIKNPETYVSIKEEI